MAIAHQMSHHEVLRFGRNLTNMLRVREREVRPGCTSKESLSHADDSEEESEEAHVEGRREAEGGEEDEEEVSQLRTTRPPRGSWRTTVPGTTLVPCGLRY